MNSRLFPALSETGLGHPVFAYDIDAGKQAAFSSSHRVDEIDGSLSESVSRIDALITALPPTESTEVLEISGARNLPLYLEKPGLRSVSEYEATIALLGHVGCRVSLGFNFRFSPAIQAMRIHMEKVAAGPVFGSARFFSRYPDGPEWGSSTTFEAWIKNNGVHAFDLLRFMFGQPAAVHFSGVTWVDDRFIAFATFHLRDGGSIRLEFGNATTSFQISLDVQAGLAKRVAFHNLARCVETDLASNLSQEVFRQRDESRFVISGYVGGLTDFLSHIRSSQLIGANLYDGLEAMKIAEEIFNNATTEFTCGPTVRGGLHRTRA